MATPPPYDPSLPPADPWHRRYWRYYNRPRPGCGCLYLVALVLVVWWLLTFFFPPLGWRYWYSPLPEGASMRSPGAIQIRLAQWESSDRMSYKLDSSMEAQVGLE